MTWPGCHDSANREQKSRIDAWPSTAVAIALEVEVKVQDAAVKGALEPALVRELPL
eukprot:CAMPEP_0202832592 /NCGR_PEP_ID=MMETSP1389-20130828/19856_1 /ASSEMBLY_ACC=CAM_ASM_000865 /TAXON_ID=302021 /ORGANISM="Rhodomonas sp., Strain CCMP768" /LENGTH=55 /DNA_ID=CAMNT_0049506655 /DNA_START=178 /DNA_END=341 /DNA_ORIENTATION=+